MNPEAIYRRAIALYPRAFREEYGADLLQLFRDQSRDDGMWRTFGRGLVDLALTVPAQHLEVHMKRNPSPAVAAAYLTIAGAGVAVAAIGGTAPASLAIGLAIALGFGFLGVAALRRGGAPASAPTDAWWKLLLLGPALVVAVIVAAGAGIEAWYLGLAMVVTGLGLAALGAVLGLVHLLSRSSHGGRSARSAA